MTDNNDRARLEGRPARHKVYGELMWPEMNPVSESYGTGYDRAIDLLDAYEAEVLAAGLSVPQREFLRHALELAADAMASTPDEYNDVDEAALESLRALAAAPAAEDGAL